LQLNVFDSSDAPPGFRSRIAKFQWTVHVPLSAFPKGCRRSPASPIVGLVGLVGPDSRCTFRRSGHSGDAVNTTNYY